MQQRQNKLNKQVLIIKQKQINFNIIIVGEKNSGKRAFIKACKEKFQFCEITEHKNYTVFKLKEYSLWIRILLFQGKDSTVDDAQWVTSIQKLVEDKMANYRQYKQMHNEQL